MKNYLKSFLIFAVALLPFAAFAQNDVPVADNSASWSYSATPAVVSQYMFRGQRLGGFSFQPAVEADYGNAAFGVWGNTPLADKVRGQSDPEIDPYASYKSVFNDSWSVTSGFTFYTYPHAASNRTTFEPNFSVNYTWGNLVLSPKAYYDTVLHVTTLEFNSTYSIPLKAINSEFDLNGSAGNYNPGKGHYWIGGVSMPFSVTKNSKLTPGFAYSKGIDSRGVISLSYNYSF